MSTREGNRWNAASYGALAGFSGDWRDTWWNEDFLQLLARRWRLSDVASLLDVGCGVGHWGQRLLPHLAPRAELTACDWEAGFEAPALERAKRLGFADR